MIDKIVERLPKTAPDPGWLPFLKVIFGMLLLTLLTALAAVIGLGHVEQSTSYGLQDILGGLLVLSGMFGQWAFGSIEKKD